MATTFTVKTAEQIRDDYLRTLRAGLIRIGIEDPNVTPGSDDYVKAQAFGDQLEVAMANAVVKSDASMPDTSATKEDLQKLLQVYGMDFRAAGGSFGNVILSSTASTTIAAETQLIDASGLRFEVTTSGTYANGATIAVQAVDTGVATNHAEDDALKWVSTPAFAAPTALVATGGLTGGVDEEDVETARERLLARLRTPPGSGNWEHVAEMCEDSTSKVQKAFVYPAVNGPGNVGVAVVGYTSDASKSREIADAIVTNTVEAYLDGQYPEHVDTIVTGVTDVDFDMSVELTLPAATNAVPAGPGGGWTDGTPWPKNSAVSATFKCTVTAVTSTTSFRVDAPGNPISTVTQIAWLSPYDWTVYKATVTSYSGSTGAWDIVIDKPFVGIATGCYISPNAENIDAYFTAVIDHFALMGPGEKTSNADVLPRAYRHPAPATAWSMAVDATMLRAITDAGDEVLAAQFLYRTDDDDPAVPASITDPPNIFVPRHVGLYEKVT